MRCSRPASALPVPGLAEWSTSSRMPPGRTTRAISVSTSSGLDLRPVALGSVLPVEIVVHLDEQDGIERARRQPEMLDVTVRCSTFGSRPPTRRPCHWLSLHLS